MHPRFVKGARGEKVRFFQSSIPYLNNNALTLYSSGKTAPWTLEEPHPSSHRILSLSNGHYGIYFTLINHELRREDRSQLSDQAAPVLVLFVPKSYRPFFPEFFISKANLDINKSISELKSVLRKFLSTWSLVRPKGILLLYGGRRHYSTSSKVPSENIPEKEEDDFESSFQKSQVDKIVNTFISHECPEDLNVIYPLYQGLKRNHIPLPSVHEYNIVLKSISMRELDSQCTISAIESKLTSLLTVYEDLLAVCSRDAAFKPNTETYNVILADIFKGALEASQIALASNIATEDYQTGLIKATEFCQVGVELFLSIKEPKELDLNTILPNMVSSINALPNVLTLKSAKALISLQDAQISNAKFYSGLIDLSRNFKTLNVLGLDNKEIYDFVSNVFNSFKSSCQLFPHLAHLEFDVYFALIQALVSNGNLAMATKFLDTILLDYKDMVLNENTSLSSRKMDVSALISGYLDAIMASGKPEDLNRAYNLFNRFKQITYIPELTIDVLNSLINNFINRYSLLELEKLSATDQDSISKEQYTIYTKIWELYEYAAIRKDFLPAMLAMAKSQGKKVNCRDFLLSLSLDLNDHSKVSRLLKEIFLHDHIISNWNISQKVCLYLLNGVSAYGNSYYSNLLWSFVEQQGQHYSDDATELNKFLSQHVAFVLHNSVENLNLLLNSKVISRAFSNFSLETDNIHGLMSICMYFMSFIQNSPLNHHQAFKVLQFESCLINQFEDTTNHYIELSSELTQFKEALYGSFRSLFTNSPPEFCTKDVSEACKALGLETVFSSQVSSLSDDHFLLDLSAYFNVNYHGAVDRFVEEFQSGCNFNQLTWSLVMNRNFIMDVLEKDSIIKISEFTERLLKLRLEASEVMHLLGSLIELKNDKVNIEVLKHLQTNHRKVLLRDSVLNRFAEHASLTDNTYFLKIFSDDLNNLVHENKSKVWLGKLFSKLVHIGQSDKVCQFLDQDFAQVLSLNVGKPSDEFFLNVVLNALMDTGKETEVSLIFRHYFSGVEGNKLLLLSEPLLTCLINYYILNGEYETILLKFGPLQDRSLKIRQSIEFARFMASLEGKEVLKMQNSNMKETVGTVALALLQENRTKNMRDIFQENRLSARNREQLFDCLIKYLTKASRLSGQSHVAILTYKFESVLKFCKEIRMDELSVDNLITIVRFLGAIKSKTLLNVLVNKAVCDNTIVPSFNFYFLRFTIPSPRAGLRLLEEFEKALAETGDDVNLSMVTDCAHAMV